MNLHVRIEPNLNLTHSHNVRLQDDLDGLSEDDGETDNNISIHKNCFKSVKIDGASIGVESLSLNPDFGDLNSKKSIETIRKVTNKQPRFKTDNGVGKLHFHKLKNIFESECD